MAVFATALFLLLLRGAQCDDLLSWVPHGCEGLAQRLETREPSLGPIYRGWSDQTNRFDLWKALACFLPPIERVAYLRDCRDMTCRDGLCQAIQALPTEPKAIVNNGVGRWQRKLLNGCGFFNLTLVSIEIAATYLSPNCPVVRPSHDRAVPYPTQFRARSTEEVLEHVARLRQLPRPTLATSFAGLHTHGKSAPFRKLVHSHCVDHDDCVSRVDIGRLNATDYSILSAYSQSQFCLQPEGDSATRQGWFDSMLCGCVPVFFADCPAEELKNIELFFEHVYSPFIPSFRRTDYGVGAWAVVLDISKMREDPEYMIKSLREIGDPVEMRENILSFLPRLQYSVSEKSGGMPGDASKTYLSLLGDNP